MAQAYPFLSLILAAIVIMGGPGPSTMSLTADEAAYGRRRCLGYLAGLVLGAIAALLVVAAGFVAALTAVPMLAPLLITVSGVYIAYLAYQIAMAPPLAEQDPATAEPSLAGGFLLGVANPKAYLAIAAVFAGNLLPIEPLWLEGVVKTGLLAGMILLIHLVWLMAGVSLSRLLRDPVRSRFVNLLLSACLVAATALSLLG